MRQSYQCLLIMLMLGMNTLSYIPNAYADAPKPIGTPAPIAEAPLTEADLVGLWSGDVRVPGHTDIWQMLPKFIYYANNDTYVTLFVNNTVLFEKDGAFVVTIEGESSASQYKGHYSLKDTTLTMAFNETPSNTDQSTSPSSTTFQYDLARWANELQLHDPKEIGFQSLLRPLQMEWQPRKGSLIYQGPSGPMQLEMNGQLEQSYHYLDGGITHYADVSASWRLVHSDKPNAAPLIKLEGVRDGADFKTFTVSLEAIPGLPAQIKSLRTTPNVVMYDYVLERLEVADTNPKQYVWGLRFDSQAGGAIEKAFTPPLTFYRSLTSPELRQLISQLPPKTRIIYSPLMVRFISVSPLVIANDPEQKLLDDFITICKSNGVQFYINHNWSEPLR